MEISSLTPVKPRVYAEIFDKYRVSLNTRISNFKPDTSSTPVAPGIPLELIEAALLLGAARKYVSWLNGGARAPIGSLEYFEPLAAEIRDQPMSETYRRYLRGRTDQLAHVCKASGIVTAGPAAHRHPMPQNSNADTPPS